MTDGASRVGGRLLPAAKLVVVDVITGHDVERHKKLAGEGDFCLRSSVSMQDRQVPTSKVVLTTVMSVFFADSRVFGFRR